MRVKVDEVKCTGHGRCYTVAPEVYESDENGFNSQRGEVIEVPKRDRDAALLGVESCPEGAILVIEHDG